MGRKSPWYHPNCAAAGAALYPLTRETPHFFNAELRAGFRHGLAGTFHHRFPLFGIASTFLPFCAFPIITEILLKYRPAMLKSQTVIIKLNSKIQ